VPERLPTDAYRSASQTDEKTALINTLKEQISNLKKREGIYDDSTTATGAKTGNFT